MGEIAAKLRVENNFKKIQSQSWFWQSISACVLTSEKWLAEVQGRKIKKHIVKRWFTKRRESNEGRE